MAFNIFDLVSAPAIGAYWTEANSNRIPYLGETLFPNRKKLGLDLSWIKGHKGLAVALKPSNFDAHAELRDRIGIEKTETEMPFFREGMKIKEKDRQELLRLQESQQAYYEMFINNIYDDAATLVSGALVQSERMRMQLLVGGKINITYNGLDYTYNFDESGEYAANNTVELSGTSLWSDHANSDPIGDLRELIDKIEGDTGSRPTKAIMSRATWIHLTQNEKIRFNINPIVTSNLIVTDQMIKQYLISVLGLTVEVYTKHYKDEKGVQNQYYPDGYVTLIPDGDLGNTWYGTTPEEADLLSGRASAQVAIVNTGIAVTTIVKPHVVNVDTIVSEIVLPSFEAMENTGLLKVL